MNNNKFDESIKQALNGFFGRFAEEEKGRVNMARMNINMAEREAWFAMDMKMEILQSVDVPELWAILAQTKFRDHIIFTHWMISSVPITKDAATAILISRIQADGAK